MINNYVCVDIETTGCQSKWSKIIEIGAVKVRNGEVVDTFSELINPGIPIPPFIVSLTGITDEMVADKEDIKSVLARFIDFAEDDVLLGHNIRFDYSFLKQNAENMNLAFDRECIDTLKIARNVHKELESKSLEFLCSYYGIEDDNHHRAFNDADITSKLYLCMAERFEQEFPDVFLPKKMEMKVKKLQPVTQRQVKYLQDLYKFHGMQMDFDVNMLSRSEASRKIDKILSEKGRILY